MSFLAEHDCIADKKRFCLSLCSAETTATHKIRSTTTIHKPCLAPRKCSVFTCLPSCKTCLHFLCFIISDPLAWYSGEINKKGRFRPVPYYPCIEYVKLRSDLRNLFITHAFGNDNFKKFFNPSTLPNDLVLRMYRVRRNDLIFSPCHRLWRRKSHHEMLS